jgi:peptide/nickel transport system substrate-binding protein
MLTRRSLLKSSGLAAAAVITRAEAQQRSREVRVGLSQDILTLDPANHRNTNTERVIRNIYDGLLTRDAQMRVLPEVAESFRQVDPLTYEFKLRQGIRFHSGSALTAEDVVFTFDRVAKDGAMAGQTSPRKSLMGPLRETRAVDAGTIRMVLSEPWPILPAMIPFQNIVSRRHIERVGQEAFQTQPDGCGPFRFAEWRRGEAVILERFPEYYGGAPDIPPAGPARVDRVVFRVIPENASRIAALLAGEVDIVSELPPSQMARVAASPNTDVVKVRGTRTFFVAMNNAKPPFNDVRVRRALNHALDKATLIARILNGTATPLRGVMSPDSWAVNNELPEYAFDLAAARRLLQEAGVASGTEMTIDTTAANREECEAIASLLSRTGLRVRVQVWEGAVINPIWTNAERRRERDMLFFSWGNASLDPSDIMVPTLKTGGRGNVAAYSNAEVDRLLDAAEVETDQGRRRQMYLRAQAVVTSEAPWIFLYLPEDIYGVSKRIDGWRPQPDGRINLHRVALR